MGPSDPAQHNQTALKRKKDLAELGKHLASERISAIVTFQINCRTLVNSIDEMDIII